MARPAPKRKAPKATAQSKKAGSTKSDAKKKTLAEKKQHVRELARVNDWAKIKALYGEKMVARAQEFMKKCQATDPAPAKPVMTPELLARQILEKNGYGPGGTVQTPVGAKRQGSMQSKPQPQSRSVRIEASTPRQNTARTSKENSNNNTPCRVPPVTPAIVRANSPETLTEEQKLRIEERRREALEKRRRIAGPTPVTPIAAPVYTRPPPVTAMASSDCRNQRPVPVRQSNQPQKQPMHNQKKDTEEISNAASMVRELEIAAQISDWDLEPIVEQRPCPPRLVTPPLPRARVESQARDNSVQPNQGHMRNASAHAVEPKRAPCNYISTLQKTLPTRPTELPSLSQELMAAAEIAMWELEHEEAIVSDICSASAKRKHEESATPRASASNQQQSAKSQARPEDKGFDLDAFIKAHFIANQLDPVVIDFVNMTLA